MNSRLQKWGNSLAVRIPKAFADELALRDNDEIELSLSDGRIVIVPHRPKYTLDELLAQVSDDNRHEEVDFGERVGSEAW